MHQENQNHLHVPVLLEQVLTYLRPKSGEAYLDLTAGYGGHAAAVMEHTSNAADAVLVDRDQEAIAQLEKRFMGQEVTIWQADFYTASQRLLAAHRQFDLILADLGVSSPHLNQASRGFSLQGEGALDMRMDQSQDLTAAHIINTWPREKLENILRRYGEEPKARQIATLIVSSRPLVSTSQLASLVKRAWPGYSKVHPATRTFQALRIAVNDELGLLQASLPIWLDNLLAPGGRIVVISFHSLEDRLVKQAFSERAGEGYDTQLRLLTKKPVMAGDQELVFNPRARSAKLRAAAKQT